MIEPHQTMPPEMLIDAGLAHNWVHQAGWNSVSQPGGLLIFERGEGCCLTDIHGETYLDGMSGAWVVNVGHGRREIATAMAEQASTLAYMSAFNFLNPPAIKLAQKFDELTPDSLTRFFFTNSGAEAVETALAMARQYHFNNGHKGRYKIISRRGSYHGSMFGGKSVSGMRHNFLQARFAPLLEGAIQVAAPDTYRPYGSMDVQTYNLHAAHEIERAILHEGPESVAVVIGETISAAAGVHVPPVEYWQIVRDICDRYGVLLILDEVLVGMGRTGKMFAFEHYGIVPDLLTLSKGVASGYAPIGVTAVSTRVADSFKGDDSMAFAHGCTYGNHAVTCATSLKNIEILQEEQLVERVAATEDGLRESLLMLQAKHPVIGDVRGKGMIFALDIVADRETKALFPAKVGAPALLTQYLLDERVFLRVNNVLHVAPPFIATRDDIDQIIHAIDRALTRFEAHIGVTH
jgi:adenosylmethionine-8-amino-7-oxononanoate aminotransferase